VIVDLSAAEVDKIFDYSIPQDLQISLGDRVKIPFGKMYTEGFVVGIKEKSEYKDLKPIAARADDFTAVIPEMIDLLAFMQDKYDLRKADILRLFIPSQ